MKLMLCDIGSIEQLNQKGLLTLLNLISDSIFIADLVFFQLSDELKFVIKNRTKIELVSFDSQTLMYALKYKLHANLHIADCVSLHYCTEKDVVMFTNEDVVCQIAEENEIEIISTQEITEFLNKKKTG